MGQRGPAGRAVPPAGPRPSLTRPWVRHAVILGSAAAALLLVGLGVNAWVTRDVIQPGVSVGGVEMSWFRPPPSDQETKL